MLAKQTPVSEPQSGVRIDKTSRLYDRMSACILPSAGFYDLAANLRPTLGGALARVPGYTGTVWSGAANNYVDLGSTLAPAAVGCTVLQVVNPGSQVNSFSWSSRTSGGTDGVELLIGPGGTAGAAAFRVNGDATGNITGLNDGLEHTIICVYPPSGTMAIYADRLANVATFSTAIASVTPSQNVRIHSRGTTYFAGKSGLFVYWNRVLATNEIDALLKNPWRIFEPRLNLFFAHVAAGGGGGSAKLVGGKLTGGGLLISGVLH